MPVFEFDGSARATDRRYPAVVVSAMTAIPASTRPSLEVRASRSLCPGDSIYIGWIVARVLVQEQANLIPMANLRAFISGHEPRG
jgi:hypothetical protein